jgi:hypothetical protein
LLDGSRTAVATTFLIGVFIVFLEIGIIWTFQMQSVLTETLSVENILITFMSGIILLVSIVVSINSIVLSQQIAPIQSQKERARADREFRADLGELTETGESPADPRTFLQLMASVIAENAQELLEVTDGSEEIQEYCESILESVRDLEDLDRVHNGDFSALWISLEIDYGTYLDRSRVLRSTSGDSLSESADEQWDDLTEAIQMFAIGRENFKTLYYVQEISTLSRMLLVVSLPAILITATAILAISASLLPNIFVFGLPPLQTFVAAIFTISLAPYVVLTSYMLRLSTVAIRTATGGPFEL